MEVDKNDIVSVQRQEGWFEVGCMDQMDGEGEDEYIQNIHNNPKRCIDHCKTKNSAFAGVQGKECRCGNSPPSGRIDWDWKKCNWPCKGGDCGNWWIVYSTEGWYHSHFKWDTHVKLSDELGQCTPLDDLTHPNQLEDLPGNEMNANRGACLESCRDAGFPSGGLALQPWSDVVDVWECHCHDSRRSGEGNCYVECKNEDKVCLINAGQNIFYLINAGQNIS